MGLWIASCLFSQSLHFSLNNTSLEGDIQMSRALSGRLRTPGSGPCLFGRVGAQSPEQAWAPQKCNSLASFYSPIQDSKVRLRLHYITFCPHSVTLSTQFSNALYDLGVGSHFTYGTYSTWAFFILISDPSGALNHPPDLIYDDPWWNQTVG